MLCPTCGKESANVRVCGFCHTPYPTIGDTRGGPRATRATGAVSIPGDPRVASARRTLMIRIGLGVAVVVALAALALSNREKEIPVGVVLPNLIKSQMSADEAAALLKSVNATAELTERGDLLLVKLAAANYPVTRAGQIAMAQQYARADAIVLGRGRPISFLDPAGATFASSDPAKGVMLTR